MTVSAKLLKRYIRLALAEANLARVPQQLLSPDQETENGNEDEGTEAVQEFSGVGSIMGYSAPLGMNPDRLGRRKNRRKK